MSRHKITATRSGSHPTMGDWDAEYEITFEYRPGAAPIYYPADNADPGYPDAVEFISIKPDAGDHGVFSDIAQQDLEFWASEWLQDAGYDDAIQTATSDLDAAREQAAELRADR